MKPSHRSLLILVALLLAAALPAAAATHEPLLVIIDLDHHRALVPEGSVIPFGMEIRAEPLARGLTPLDARGGPRLDGALSTQSARRMPAAPLKIEFAPAARFAATRQRYEAQVKRAIERRNGRGLVSAAHTADDCFPTYVEDDNTGVYGTYYHTMTSTFCQQSSGITPNAYLDWSFTASGDYTDDDEYIDPYAYVGDENNNFNCFQPAYGYTSPVECTASNHTQLLQVGCLNHVTTGALLYTIEYLNNYVPNYLGYNLTLTYCTYFY